jgi:hypothetical protein
MTGGKSFSEWVAPTECDQCEHPISQHMIWYPEPTEDAWMHCEAPECDSCWHHWPMHDWLSDQPPSDDIEVIRLA